MQVSRSSNLQKWFAGSYRVNGETKATNRNVNSVNKLCKRNRVVLVVKLETENGIGKVELRI